MQKSTDDKGHRSDGSLSPPHSLTCIWGWCGNCGCPSGAGSCGHSPYVSVRRSHCGFCGYVEAGGGSAFKEPPLPHQPLPPLRIQKERKGQVGKGKKEKSRVKDGRKEVKGNKGWRKWCGKMYWQLPARSKWGDGGEACRQKWWRARNMIRD